MGPIPVIDLTPSPRGLPGARRPKPSLPYCFFPFSPFLPNSQTSFEALDERAEVNDVSFSVLTLAFYRMRAFRGVGACGRDALGAFDKTVCRWTRAVAVDAV